MIRRTVGAIVVVVAMLGAAVVAHAGQTSGLGQTHRSATLGFNAKSDLSGELQYISNNGRFSAHCSGYRSYQRSVTRKGYPKVKIKARCVRANGRRVWLRAAFVDRGEPATRDRHRILWGRKRHFRASRAIIRDIGLVRSGNIQIRPGTSIS